MEIGNLNLKGLVLAAPLAGVSTRPFRVLAIRLGAAMTYTEMISSDGIIRRQKKTMALMEFGSDEQPLGIQLFGSNPEIMGQAATIVREQFHPDLIDLNFGCPVKKVVRKNGGAAVLKDLELTEDIIRAVVEASKEIPVTIKIRSGWDETRPVYVEVGRIAEKAGAAAITLHARSRSRGFAGVADWSAIKRLKESINIPVIGNGDIKNPVDAKRMLSETGCDAVMVGRMSIGNPFIFSQINHYLRTGELPAEPSLADKIELALNYVRMMVDQFGEIRGIKKTRRNLVWLMKGFPRATEIRSLLFQIETFEGFCDLMKNYQKDNIVPME